MPLYTEAFGSGNYPSNVSTRDVDQAAAARYADANAYVDTCPACRSDNVNVAEDGLVECYECLSAWVRR